MVKIKQQMPLAPKPPCEKDCPDRSAVCAVNCERWSAYVKARGEYYAEKLKISKSNDFVFSCVTLKDNNAKEFLLNNRKTVLMFFIAKRQSTCWLAQKNL